MPPEILNPLPGVSDEAHQKLVIYHQLLLKWQVKINLIGKNTIENAWQRHFADSAQLATFLPEKKLKSKLVLLDLGSGAGFPGLALAILRPDLQVHLVESDQKKCAFLKTVSRETDTIIIIHNSRIEGMGFGSAKGGERAAEIATKIKEGNLGGSTEALRTGYGVNPDVITARALAPLTQLLDYCVPFIANPHVRLIFPKGAEYEAEIKAACDKYSFDLEVKPSVTDSKAKILLLENIQSQ